MMTQDSPLSGASTKVKKGLNFLKLLFIQLFSLLAPFIWVKGFWSHGPPSCFNFGHKSGHIRQICVEKAIFEVRNALLCQNFRSLSRYVPLLAWKYQKRGPMTSYVGNLWKLEVKNQTFFILFASDGHFCAPITTWRRAVWPKFFYANERSKHTEQLYKKKFKKI